jgi:hypothetical protein
LAFVYCLSSIVQRYFHYFQTDEENPTVTLKDAIDLNELRQPNGEGVCFEIAQENDFDGMFGLIRVLDISMMDCCFSLMLRLPLQNFFLMVW